MLAANTFLKAATYHTPGILCQSRYRVTFIDYNSAQFIGFFFCILSSFPVCKAYRDCVVLFGLSCDKYLYDNGA